MASNDEIVALINQNHVDLVQRMTRVETKFESFSELNLPERVSKLENKNSWFSGIVAAVSAIFSSGLTILTLRK